MEVKETDRLAEAERQRERYTKSYSLESNWQVPTWQYSAFGRTRSRLLWSNFARECALLSNWLLVGSQWAWVLTEQRQPILIHILWRCITLLLFCVNDPTLQTTVQQTVLSNKDWPAKRSLSVHWFPAETQIFSLFDSHCLTGAQWLPLLLN